MTTPAHPAAFGPDALAAIDAAYPNHPAALRQRLAGHPLLSIPALADLAGEFPADQVEYARALVPVGARPDEVEANGLSLADTIRGIEDNGSWCVLKQVQRVPALAALLTDLLAEIAPVVEPRTGPMLTPQGFIFISSPHAVTPFHFDPEHNVLMQLRGTKDMHVWPAGDARFAPAIEHERYHVGGHRALAWDDGFRGADRVVPLAPGDAVLMPVMAPHYVQNGPAVSISLSITWRSIFSYAEADAYGGNSLLRRAGMNPGMVPRWPARAHGRAALWRVWRKVAR